MQTNSNVGDKKIEKRLDHSVYLPKEKKHLRKVRRKRINKQEQQND